MSICFCDPSDVSDPKRCLRFIMTGMDDARDDDEACDCACHENASPQTDDE